MIDKKFAKAQIARLSGLDYFPPMEESRRELSDTLSMASCEKVAKDVVDAVIESWTQCPKPAEIRRLVYEHSEKTRQQRQNCPACGGTGFVTSWWLVSHCKRQDGSGYTTKAQIPDERTAMQLLRTVGKDQSVYSGAAMCECHAGYGKEVA